MYRRTLAIVVLSSVVLVSGCARASETADAFDVEKLFATSCGWCHSNGGRAAGRGPQLMGTTLSDGEIVRRIVAGSPGKMPGFGATFKDVELLAIIKYIRELKPEGAPK